MKNLKQTLLNILTALTVTLFLVAHASGQGVKKNSQRTETFKGKKVAAGEVLVKFRKSASASAVANARRNADAELDRKVGGTGVRLLRSRSKDVASLVAELSARADVLYAEPNLVIDVTALPDDARFAELWGLQNLGQNVGGVAGTFGADIGALSAWDLTTGSRSNVVAVVDTGVDYTHPDLAANMWSAPAPFTVNIGGQTIQCAAGTHGFDAITMTCDPADEYNHGTHVAGTIGAVGGNHAGITGVSQTASVMALKFMDATGSGTLADAIDAIEFGIQAKQIFGAGANVRVLANSWGWNGDASQALLDEINRANDADMLFVAAAGNGGADRLSDDNDQVPFYPGGYTAPNVIAVAATNNQDHLTAFSNYGRNSVHLTAPGELILSTIIGGGYDSWSGTSMATPHVAGAAALVLSRCQLDTASLKNALLNNVDPVASLSAVTVTGGRLNVNKALLACNAGSPGLSLAMSDSPDPATADTELTYTLTVKNDSSSEATGVTLTDTLPSGVTFVSASSGQGTCGVNGTTITCALGTMAAGATANVTIVVKPTAAGAITNTATVTGNETDPNPGDNTATATTMIQGSLGALTLSPTSVLGSKPSVGTVTLSQPAPASGAVIKLTSSNTAVATVPASITLAAGATSKTFTVTTKAVPAPSTVTVTANYSGSTQTATLDVQPPALTNLTLTPATISSPCQTSEGRVYLSAMAPAGGSVVALTSSNSSAQVPASVVVPAGATSAAFTVTPSLVTSKQTSTITASYRGASFGKVLTMMPVGVAALTLTPNPVTGPNVVTGTVTLTCNAPAGGLAVTLTTSNSTVARPTVGSITIAAGAKTGTFNVSTVDVTSTKTANITAAAGGVSKAVTLTVN
ncbi:MAG TPA: S8 family serine peptidase [Pyrinomonadaceae bacterium]|nr:S8 family serine peptidase [Pyrinomonadaceae bacterium]